MRLRPALPILLLALLILPALPRVGSAGHVYDSEKLRIVGDVSEEWIDAAAGLGTQLYAALKAHFGREPEADELPLKLILYPRRSTYEIALRKQGIKGHAAHAGGWTTWRRGESHVWVQKEPFDTRRLILHELVHQFHDKCQAVSRRGRGAWWYREGLAEWFGWHRRTKKGLLFGQLDAVALNSTARYAAARSKESAFVPWRLGIGKDKASYVEALALVGGILMSRDGELKTRFQRWERQILAKGGDHRAFEVQFADRKKDLRGAIADAWASLFGQWAPTTLGWDEQDDVIRVTQREKSDLWRMGTPHLDRWRAVVEVVTGTEPKAAAGVAISFSRKRSVRVFAERDHVVLLDDLGLRPRGGAALTREQRAQLPEGRKTVLDVRRTATGIEVHATRGGKRVTLKHALPGVAWRSWGLTVRATGARFRFLPREKAAKDDGK